MDDAAVGDAAVRTARLPGAGAAGAVTAEGMTMVRVWNGRVLAGGVRSDTCKASGAPSNKARCVTTTKAVVSPRAASGGPMRCAFMVHAVQIVSGSTTQVLRELARHLQKRLRHRPF